MTAERACGSCNLCCNLLEINEIGRDGKPFEKSAWSLCRHCDIANAAGCCTIHASRPESCRQYRCAWLMGFGGPDDRPDATKVLVHPEESEGFGPMLNFMELEPGVTKNHPPAAELLRKAMQIAWINAISIISSRTAARTVFVRDKASPGGWEERRYESFQEQFPNGIPVTDWRTSE